GKEYIAAGGGGGGGSANAPQGSTSGVNDGKISVGAIGVNVFEDGQSTYTAPRDLSFTGSKLRYEASNNPSCGQDITPDVVGKKSYTVSANNSIWGDPCYGAGKRIVGSLFYALGSIGGQGQDSSCDFFCDGAGAGGGGGGLNGGAGGALFRSSNPGEAGGGGGSSGSNSATGGVVLQSEYVTSDADGSITIRYVPVFPPSEITILSDAKTNSRSHTLQVLVRGSKELAVSEIQLTGSALSQAGFRVTALTKIQEKGQTRYSFRITQSGNQNIQGNLSATIRSVQSNTVELDQIAPEATLTLRPNTAGSDANVYELRTTEPVTGLTQSSFTPIGTSTNCRIGYLTGSANIYLVSLEGCSPGTFGLKLKTNSLVDATGNRGPVAETLSELNDKSAPQVSVNILDGVLPKQFLEQPVTSIFSQIDPTTQAALEEIGIFAPMEKAPTLNVLTNLAQFGAQDVFAHQSSQQVTVGSSVDLGIEVSPEMAQSLDAVAFLQTGDVWQFLGRKSFSGTSLSGDSFGIAKAGTFKIRIVLVGKDVVTNMSLPSPHGKSLPIRIAQAVTEPETLLGNQQVDITLTAVPGPDGAPVVVSQLQPPIPDPGAGVLDLTLPTINIGEPVANPAIGATGDDLAPPEPFDPLGSPESVAHVVKTTATTVAVVSAVAAAASAAAGAAAGAASAGSSGASSASSSSASKQEVNQEDGEISNIDASVESFTSAHTGWGDKIPIFRLGIFTFLDRFTHDLTERTAKYTPVGSKIINDGAYLRALLGSLWLAFPIGGVFLALAALAQPGTELIPPVWYLFVAIAVLGLFDAFSGLVATLVYVVGVIAAFGISSVSDVRLILGIIVMGFGPALIAVAFRQIRKHFETGFSYIWERLVDVAVLGFFTYWTVGSLVSTLPALAGKTLSAANHVQDFAVLLTLAIVVRILLEELTARSFAQRLDKINPTEVPETSQLQKVLSTLLRLGVFIFVTAAFMGNTWQVWVGSIIFILPNILSWFEDRLPNSPLLWKLIPTGLPGLAFSLIVASYSSLYISQWIGDWPDFAQWSFMLLPIPMFLIGLIGLFGREGQDDEDRPIKAPRWRYIYRIGGIVMLVVTASLAGVI
ncbi:MAG: hypothetical protein ACKOFA_03730, partial [Rhodoluna sp.]